MITAKVTESVITAEALASQVKNDGAGAVVTFSGDVRNHDKGKGVTSLNYEIHPTAQSVIEKITNEVVAKHDVVNVAVAHRYGAIPIGESAFVVAVSAAHRAPAFECCEELVERVKAELPIWKFQEFTDGTTEWVNSA
ncbi:MAG: molybdenum cofactor biosynthesis protein MoaE [Candidatus Nanopelagicaceae bacterium]